MDQFLIYRFDSHEDIENGKKIAKPLTPEYINGQGRLGDGWEQEPPRRGWALVENQVAGSEHIIPALDLIDQVFFHIKEAAGFTDQTLPAEYQAAAAVYSKNHEHLQILAYRIEDLVLDMFRPLHYLGIKDEELFRRMREEMERNADYQEKIKEFMDIYSALKLPKLILPTPAELIYDCLVISRSEAKEKLKWASVDAPKLYYTSAVDKKEKCLVYINIENISNIQGAIIDHSIYSIYQTAHALLSRRF